MDVKTEDVTPEEAKGLILSLANPDCSHCYGRGYTGWNLQGNPVICKCVKKALAERREKK